MPNIGIHLLLTNQALRHWSASGSAPPFAVDDRRAIAAFRHGAMLPDAGYFPRGDRLFSELAHLFRSGDLLTALFERASSDLEHAHAWGWATHVRGDLAIHPLINEAHGEWLHGARSRPVTSTEDEIGHMRLEYGLDAAVFASYGELDRLSVPPPPQAALAAYVDGAFRSLHGWSPGVDAILGAYRMAARMARLCTLTNRVHTARLRRRPLHVLLRVCGRSIAPPCRLLPGRWNRSSAAHAVLNPLPCPPWLLQAVGDVVAGFGARLDELREQGPASLGNHDLITGLPCDEGRLTARTIGILRLLAERTADRPEASPSAVHDPVTR